MSAIINNQKVLKNTTLLYLRMGLVMVVNFYTSRIVLDVLGVTDYGIYTIVGSVVVLFGFVNNILTIAIRRYIATGIVTENSSRVASVLKASIRAVSLLSIIVIFLLETIALWFINYKLNIPDGRMIAANWCFQFSVVTFVLNLLTIPYNAAIVSYERMGIYAYLGILDVILKLILVLILCHIHNFDVLIIYSFLICVTTNFVRALNVRYCKKNLIVGIETVEVDKTLVKSIFSYSSWAMLGAVIGILASQGVIILMNIFYGVVISAAIGISQQVSAAINQFGGNFQTAFNPQLTKSYATSGLSDETYNFCLRTSKMSLALMIIICMPLLLNINIVLDLWLVEVPYDTAEFCVIAMIYVIFEVLSMPIYVLIYAKGDLKLYSITLSIIQLLYIIIVYFSCRMGLSPVQVASINIINAIALYVARLYIVKRQMEFRTGFYLRNILFPIIAPVLLCIIIWNIVAYAINGDGLLILTIRIIIIGFVLLLSMYIAYLNREEKIFVLKLLRFKK